MIELAGGFSYNNADACFTGPCRTPWNTDYWAGGSSSGSGAATAAGLVAFAIGSETSGSIITPAAFCGLSGLRPTYGRVSRYGAMALCWTLDKLGPMCRSAEDCSLVLAAIAGKDGLDPTTVGKAFNDRLEKKRFKVGVVKGCLEKLQPEVKKNFETSLKVLRRFCDVTEDVGYPDLPFSEAVSTIVRAEGASAFRDLLDSGKAAQLRSASDRWGGYMGAMVLAVDYLQALRLRGPMKKALDELYAKYDALVAPSRATVSYPIGQDFDKVYVGLGGGPPLIPAGNLVGQPGMSIPNGLGQKGLPTGLMLTGRVWGEATLLAIARAYQKETDWHTKQPAS
jgi:aspartyl-tRNA(Asn)/glutamyl-tRNA(Gln) amidotransferase subunit A